MLLVVATVDTPRVRGPRSATSAPSSPTATRHRQRHAVLRLLVRHVRRGHGARRARRQPRRALGRDRGHHRSSPRSWSATGAPARSLEAAWKYVVICSVGVAIAFLGTVLLYYAAAHAGLAGRPTLDWAHPAGHAPPPRPGRDPRRRRRCSSSASAPRPASHRCTAWLPDAHSQAPAPVSALMSGVLLSWRSTRSCASRPSPTPRSAPATCAPCSSIAALLSLAVAAALLIAPTRLQAACSPTPASSTWA